MKYYKVLDRLNWVIVDVSNGEKQTERYLTFHKYLPDAIVRADESIISINEHYESLDNFKTLYGHLIEVEKSGECSFSIGNNKWYGRNKDDLLQSGFEYTIKDLVLGNKTREAKEIIYAIQNPILACEEQN